MSDLIEAMARRIFAARMEREGAAHATWAWRYETQLPELLKDATAALAALRETHHLIPKDQEPVGHMRRWAFDGNEGTPENRPRGWKLKEVSEGGKILADDVPLYALEKRHDD